MFCLGCGTELPAQATTCAVCGREVGRAAGDGEPVSPRPAPTASLAVAAPRSLAFSAIPSIQPDDLAMPGLPRDAQGRALLITAVAMAADILAPWRVVFGQHEPLTQSGLPALGVLALIALALAPLIKPVYRRQPSVAVAPLLVGAVSLGVALTYWGFISQLNAQAINPGGPLVSSPPASVVISPDIGLYLFLLGSGVLILVGYQIFLVAATAATTARSAAASLAVPPATALPLPPDASHSVAAEPASDGENAVATLGPDVTAHTGTPMPGANGVAPAIAGANGHHHDHPAPPTPSVTPLPGSIAWHQAPALPQPVRPSRLGAGWARHNGHRGPR